MAISCQRKHANLDVQGHRGARGLYPENTISGFLHAVDLGATTIELDVVMSGDRQIVVSHEPVLNPNICLDPYGNKIPSNTVYNLYQMDYDSIAKCDCGSLGNPDFPNQQKLKLAKPLLIDVIFAVQKHCEKHNISLPHFSVEIKSKADNVFLFHPPIAQFVDAVVDVLQANLEYDTFTVQCFDVLTLQYLKRIYPEIKLSYLVEGLGHRTIKEFDAEIENLGFYPAIYSCYFPMLTGDLVNHIHQQNVKVIPWTVNDKDDMLTMMNLGVDGLITDYPDRLLVLLGGLKN